MLCDEVLEQINWETMSNLIGILDGHSHLLQGIGFAFLFFFAYIDFDMLECRNLSLIACQQMRRNYGESGNDLMKSLST
jgi:hypothetical protein